ncbi:LuxR family two component transcriptional regulator [Roseiarcus fermentans]|uniref:LuxR family two component transcriptional regulator n=1 Tax=Roseiarcus fermentans TaxID=1473586 RepID=A0A366FKM3_9HYPH|nr:response regulator transcription factor [Roseiarcus fermentans]RBP14259.1 LuxR family two component transcriptional regulator [Roseiarcus fermentans]
MPRQTPVAELRIVVADDHPVVLAGVKALIESSGDMIVVGEAGDGVTAARLATDLKPDVLVLDVSMPGLGGTKVAERLREAAPRTRILVHTVHEDVGYLRQMLELGVNGYILKRSSGDQLVRAIRFVAEGGVYIDPLIAGKLLGGPSQKQDIENRPGVELSERENEVLKLTAAGYSHKEIATQLNVSVKSVETYKARGMEKLGFQTRVELVRYASSKGWLDGS